LTTAKWALAEPDFSPRQGQDAIPYWERAADDARLTLTTIQAACEHGAIALNYAEVLSLLKAQGRVAGVGFRDGPTGETFEVRAAQVVNATGPWSDAVRGLDEATPTPGVRPNKGIHVVVPHSKFPIRGQVNFAAVGDKRRLYALPWRTTSLIGTTDNDFSGDLESVHALSEEVAWLLESVNQAFADQHLTKADVVSTFAGLRPLVRGEGGAAYGASREHHMSVSASGLISIIGGKLTTHRLMAKEVMDSVAAQLGRGGPCRTDRVPLDSGLGQAHDVPALIERARSAAAELDEDVLRYLVSTYGSQCLAVLGLAAEDKGLSHRLVPGLPYLYAEIPYAAQHEMACTLNDLLMRRLRLIHEAPEQGWPLALGIARVMGVALGWSADDIAQQVEAYGQQVALTRRFDPHWKLPEAQHERP
jgi:glycerol-3-phosphate dehydrogenase